MTVVLAIIPVFLIILCGYICRYHQFPDINFWRGAEKITYFLLFPALLLSKMATASLANLDIYRPLLVILLLFSIITSLFILFKPFIRLNNAQFTSVYQGGIRFNTYIGLAVVSTLYGSEGLVVAVVIASFMVPIINVLCVVMLEYYGERTESKAKQSIVKSILTNPLILACISGMGINLSGIGIPNVLFETLDIFARAALPLGLLTVGAALTLNSIKSASYPVLISSLFKFLLLPILTMTLCILFKVDMLATQARCFNFISSTTY